MIILGLGSNIGDRLAYLGAAVKAPEGLLQGIRVSAIYESKACLPPGAPMDWNKAFLNMAIAGLCPLGPQELLAEIKAIEQKLGRLDRGHWAPREIDIDILAMQHRVIKTEKLIIPHPELLNRDFALVPLAEVAPDWAYPISGEYYQCRAEDIVRTKNIVMNEQFYNSGLGLYGV